MFVGAARIRQMTNEVAVQLVNVDTPQIVKLLALKAEHLMTIDHGDMDAVAIQYIAIHDRPPMQEYPSRRLRSLAGDSETNRALFPLGFWQIDPMLHAAPSQAMGKLATVPDGTFEGELADKTEMPTTSGIIRAPYQP
jgi:hypothetical protein